MHEDTEVADLRTEASRVRTGGDRLALILWIVAAWCLVFTMVNVFILARRHDVPWQTAWMLDPILSVSLLSVLLGDGILARHGERSTGWAQVLKYAAGGGTLALNVWQPVADQDHAGILIHSLPPALLVILAEVTPAYRRRIAVLADSLDRRASDTERMAVELAEAKARQAAEEAARHAAAMAEAEATRKAAERAARAAQKDIGKDIQPPRRRAVGKDKPQVMADVPSGLTDSAVTVYSYMLGRGDVPRSDIVRDTEMSVSTVKAALGQLISKGHVVLAQRGIYRSVDPDLGGTLEGASEGQEAAEVAE